MPGLKHLLKRKEKEEKAQDEQSNSFTFLRSTTISQEVIQPPTYPDDDDDHDELPRTSKEKRRTLGFHSSSSPTKDSASSSQQLPIRPRGERRLSDRLHLHHRDRSPSVESSSSILPRDLPEAPEAIAARPQRTIAVSADHVAAKAEREQQEQREAQWEKRATILAMNSPFREQHSHSESTATPGRSRSPSISDRTGDVNIQEAIRLHEAGDLVVSTEMFGELANDKGANNALSQVLYGLALRHGWGIPVEPEKAIHYLSLAASNSASSIEEQALASGLKKGGSAKGELVLAIFELANCFRNGWGVKKDSVAARQYYETAANLGDTDAMEEAAWCYLEGFGGSKDKVRTYVAWSLSINSIFASRTLFRAPSICST